VAPFEFDPFLLCSLSSERDAKCPDSRHTGWARPGRVLSSRFSNEARLDPLSPGDDARQILNRHNDTASPPSQGLRAFNRCHRDRSDAFALLPPRFGGT